MTMQAYNDYENKLASCESAFAKAMDLKAKLESIYEEFKFARKTFIDVNKAQDAQDKQVAIWQRLAKETDESLAYLMSITSG